MNKEVIDKSYERLPDGLYMDGNGKTFQLKVFEVDMSILWDGNNNYFRRSNGQAVCWNTKSETWVTCGTSKSDLISGEVKDRLGRTITIKTHEALIIEIKGGWY